MKTQNSARWATLTLCLASSTALAEWRCDCTTIVDSCSATVTIADAWIDVTSDHQQCARVDYFVDGLPFVAMVVGGEERQNWLTRSADPDILIQSCQVCVDHASDTPQTTAATASTELAPVIEVEPAYPEAAAARGTEGFVEISFTVTPFGEVENPRVTSAEPAGVFDQAALAAIARWRYPSDETRAPATLSHRFPFELGATLMALAPAAAEPAVARRPTAERNQCVRERVSYDYGEMVEVGLINACADAVVVYSCAEGTGRLQDQWVCVSSDQLEQALVRPSDNRVGNTASVTLPDGRRNFQFASEMFVARAPNSQYWWLACGVEDAACRGSGQQWLRSMDRQLASIDPRDRITRPLARAN